MLRPDGTVRWVWASTAVVPGPNGEQFVLSTTQDVTARTEAEAALLESEANLAAVARCVQSGADPRPVVADAVLAVSGASTVALFEAESGTGALVATALSGIRTTGRVGMTLPMDGSLAGHVWGTGAAELLTDTTADPRVNARLSDLGPLACALWEPVVVQDEVVAVLAVTWREQVQGPDGRAVRAVRLVAGEAGSSLHAARTRGELEAPASTDPLTGALNRRAWDVRMAVLTDQAQATSSPLTVALVDLDHFKADNDTHGHAAGDDLLCDFDEAARGCLRAVDVFARWGGEEFVVALPGATTEEARALLDRVRRSIPSGTASVGATTWCAPGALAVTVARADAALYEAERGGRDQVVVRVLRTR